MENIMENEDRAADSLKSRILVFEHLKKLNLKNVFIVDSLEKMLKISLTLWGITTEIERIREGCMKDTKD